MLEKHAVTGNLISIEIFSFLVSFAPFSVGYNCVCSCSRQTDRRTDKNSSPDTQVMHNNKGSSNIFSAPPPLLGIIFS